MKPVVAYLEETLGMEVKDFVATNYAGIVEALKNGTADVGFMGPLQYVIAHDKAGARVLLGELYNGKPTYQSKIFVRKDSGITTLEQLKGKTVAFTDPISSSGYLYPLMLFKDAGLIKNSADEFFKRVYFAEATNRPFGRCTTNSSTRRESASSPITCCGLLNVTRS